MKDYVGKTKPSCNASLYPLSNYLTYDNTSAKYECYVSKFSNLVEPSSFREVPMDPRWVDAMKLEIKALDDNKTWDVVELPSGRNAVGSKWIYKIKHQDNGEVERFKARLVAKGYSQKEGLDYHENILTGS